MIAYLDCSTGISGDKFLGALLDAGTASGAFSASRLAEIAAALAPEARVEVGPVMSHGMSAVGVRVSAAHEPPHRHWRDVRALLEGADLPPRTRDRALAAFSELAIAEAAAHGCAVDDVHFHEVGAIDSIVDVVGACAGMEALGIDELVASPVAVGSGTVRTSHGELPVPAPATARLLVGMPILAGPAECELTTPTGAALLRACASGFGHCPPMVPRAIGTGAGTRDIGVPNVCRLIVGDRAAEAPALHVEPVELLESNIDHLSPEAASVAVEQLLAEGALDAWTSPIVMKKGRSAFILSVLAGEAPDGTHLASRVVALTGTLGVRRTALERYVAERAAVQRETPHGVVHYKVGPAGSRPEADDVARIARETGRGFADVARELLDYLG